MIILSCVMPIFTTARTLRVTCYYLTFFDLMEPPEPISTSTCETLDRYMYYVCGSRSKVKYFEHEGSFAVVTCKVQFNKLTARLF